MQLPPEEPYFGPWQAASAKAFAETVQHRSKDQKPVIAAVDGRSAGGKTTLAALLSRNVPGAAVVHTDDIAWHHSFFNWSDLLLEAVLEPARRGQAVDYRPTAWVERGREGAITVPLSCTLLILEGVGAARRELTHVLDAVIWVQSDMAQARARGIARDGDAAIPFWDEWMTAELSFLTEQKPWERADFIVCGTPDLDHDPASEVVVSSAHIWPDDKDT